MADIGNDNRIGPASRQIALVVMTDQAAVNSPSELRPVIPFAAKFNIFPAVFFSGIIPGPRSIKDTGQSLDVFIHLAVADIADIEIFTKLENLLIEIAQMPAGTIDHKTQDLFKKLKDLNPLAVLADRTEKSIRQWKNVDVVQIGDKQCQSGSAGQAIAGLLDATDFLFSFPVIAAIFIHEVLHLADLAAIVIILVNSDNDYSMLNAKGGLFYFKNRSS